MKKRVKRCACGRAKCKNEHVESFGVEGPSETDGRGHGRTLAGEVFSWPTPTCADGVRGSGTYARGNPTLVGAVKGFWPTPTTNRATYGRRNGKKSPTLRGLGQLNPSFVEALMGFPAGWID